MTRRLAAALTGLAIVALMTGSLLIAHEGHDHKVMGTVTMAARDHVMVKSTDGKDVTVQITRETKVTRDKQAMKAEDITVGTRVAITAIMEKHVMKARTIQVGQAPKTAAR